jgi:hypothetical protein
MRVTIRAASLAGCKVRLLCGALLLATVVAGCGAGSSFRDGSTANPASLTIQGKIRGGQQPVTGSTVQLYAAGNSGYGAGAQALLSTPVTTDQYGNFNIPNGDYNCQTSAGGQPLPATAQTYLVATGGNPGLAPGTNNSAIALLAALGPCSGLSASTYVDVDEVTTVASVWPLAPFLGSGAQVGTVPGNTQGLATAFANVGNLVTNATGQAPGTSVPPGVTIPVAEINTLADILAPCVNSAGATGCSALFAAATPPGGSAPTNTLDAALDIALNPSNDVAALFNLMTPAAPFEPALASAPASWSLGNSIVTNPVPSIASLSPASVKVGSAAQTLTIHGANFLASSTVTYNGVAHAATYVSASQLTIPLSSSDLYALGTYPVAVSNPVPGGGTSSPVSLQVYGDAQNSPVIGSIVPNSSYELDAFDIQGNYAYILGDNGNQGSGSSAAQFYVVDITNPASMTVVSTTPITGYEFYGQSGIRVQGKYVYLESSTGTASTNLLQIYDVSNPSAPALVGSVQLPLYSLGVWVSGNYAYTISFIDGCGVCSSYAGVLSIVDVSNPASPTMIGSTNTGTAGVHVADIKVVGNYAYVSGQSTDQNPPLSQVLVFDVSNPASPYLLSSLQAGHSPQGLDVEGNFWYQTIYDNDLTYGVPTLDIYNISNPSTFYQAGTAILSGSCHPQDVAVEGTIAYVACYANSSVAVVDVSNPASPTVDGYISLPATSYPIFLEAKGRYVYSISNIPGGVLSVIDTGK